VSVAIESIEDGRPPAGHGRATVLHPVDRIMELLFGLLMALSFTGALSVAQSGRTEIREMFVAAFGCNLAWGIVDAVMYLIRTQVDRAKSLSLLRAVRTAPDAASGRSLIEGHLTPVMRELVAPTGVEAIRGSILALPEPPARSRLEGRDWLAALAIFLLVVLATFPVVLPFALMHDVGAAKNVSRAVALTMLFLAGFALGRYAGYGSWRAAFSMVVLGTGMVGVILALGG
jgi:VIT1/CCC1 family predicted Fe2+/Mn2+ transporter